MYPYNPYKKATKFSSISLSNVKNGDHLTIHLFTCKFKMSILCSSAENGPQILHYYSFAASSGYACDKHWS